MITENQLQQSERGILEIPISEPEEASPVFSFDLNEFADVENKAGEVKTENALMTVEQIPQDKFEPKTETELIQYAKKLSQQCQASIIVTYYELGTAISEFYKKDYGNSIIEKIAVEIDINSDTLRKIVKFAKTYTAEQVRCLLSGRFALTWNSVAQNLTVKPAKLIETYQAAEDPKQFHRSILNSKPKAVSKRAKAASNSAPVIDAANIANNHQEEGTVDESYEIVDAASGDEVGDSGSNLGQRAEDGEEARRRSEVETLEKQLMEKEDAYRVLESQFNEINAELAAIEGGLQELRELVQRVLEMCENGAGNEYLTEELRKVLDSVPKIGH